MIRERQVLWPYGKGNVAVFCVGEVDESERRVRGTWGCPEGCSDAIYKDGPVELRKQ